MVLMAAGRQLTGWESAKNSIESFDIEWVTTLLLW